MDIRDLRIGDIVTTNGLPILTVKGEYYKIVGMDSKNTFEDFVGSVDIQSLKGRRFFDGRAWADSLEPIPITDDLLINVGFKEIGNHPNDGISYELPDSGKYLYCIVFHTFSDTESYEFNIHTERDTKNITYLHELQHFVWEHIGIELKIE